MIQRFKGIMYRILVKLKVIENPFGTHRKVLIDILNSLPNSSLIIELGVGFSSSSIFNKYSQSNPNVNVYSYETDGKYLKKISEKYQRVNYLFNYVESYTLVDQYSHFENIDLVFVDQSPWQSRIDSMLLLSNKTSIFILHDFDYYTKKYSKSNNSLYNIEFFIELFPNYEIYIYGEKYPPTLVLKKRSNN
jgi:hypothetical protein